jgi:protein SCO1/2
MRAAAALALVLLASPLGCGSLQDLTRGPRVTAAPGGTWTDEHGAPIELASFRGSPVVVSAFFTSCTVRCPMTIEKLKDVDAAYRRRGQAVSILVLTLDPGTDTPERLGRYKRDHHLPDHWHFLWGSLPETRRLARTLRVHAAYDDNHIDHDVQIAVFDAKGGLARSYTGWTFDPNSAVVP